VRQDDVYGLFTAVYGGVQPEDDSRVRLRVEVPGEPLAKQSARFRVQGGRVRSFQRREVVVKEATLAALIHNQLPAGWLPLEGPVVVHEAGFLFSPPKSWTKRKRAELDRKPIPKLTRPDLDNLEKLLFDACSGILWFDDAQIVTKLAVYKGFSSFPRIILDVSGFPEGAA